MENLIVTRHATLIKWLFEHGINGRVNPEPTHEDVRGKNVYGGVLPLWMIGESNSATEILMDIPSEERTRVNKGDFTTEEMALWKATMRTFVVTDNANIIAGVQEFGKERIMGAASTHVESLRIINNLEGVEK